MQKISIVLMCLVWLSMCGISDAAVVSPPHLGNLGLWLDASDLDGDGLEEGILESGINSGVVTNWMDKSGEGNHAHQSVVASRPVYVAASGNGRPALGFDGVDDFLDIDFTANPHTIFIVSRDGTQLGTWRGMFNLCYGGASATTDRNKRQPFLAIRSTTDTRLSVSYIGSDGVNATFNMTGSSSWNVLTVIKPSGLTPVTAYRNGQQAGQTVAINQEPLDGTDWIGKGPGPWNGEISEIIVYRKALTESEMNIVGYYLEQKYGLSTAYQAGRIPLGAVSSEDDMIVSERLGDSVSFAVTLLHQPTADVTVTVSIDPNNIDDIVLSAGQQSGSSVALTFNSANYDQPQEIIVSVVDDDVAEDDETARILFTLDSADPVFTDENGYIPPVYVTILDNDGAGISFAPLGDSLTVSEQEELVDTNKFSVLLTKAPTSDVSIEISADQSQVTLSSYTLNFSPANYNEPQVVTVAAVDDDLFEDNPHSFSLNFTATSLDNRYEGFAAGPLSGLILDNDCGPGRYLSIDINQDCKIDIDDLVLLAASWLKCSTPNIPGCIDPEAL